jgi:DNA adenine methylase
LLNYCTAWDEAGVVCLELMPELLSLYKAFMAEEMPTSILIENIRKLLLNYLNPSKYLLFSPNFIIHPYKFFNTLSISVADKSRRIKNISNKKGQAFDDSDMADHIETSIRSGLYLFLRQLTNLQFKGSLKMSDEKAVANWYFVREFCYASMFRYNRKGGFNIPYGGIAYNKKNFRQKVENIFSEDVRELFENATFYNLDFELFLKETNPGEEDFIFLDPPYDSEFSEYDQNTFTKPDQVRLRDVLFETPAKWMLVIKETDFIRCLYTSEKCRFIEFDKTYTYNVRGRNNRETRHLIIVNY